MSAGDWFLIGLVLLVTVCNPVLWIRAAMLLLGPARRARFLTALRAQIAAEPNERARVFELWVFRVATGERP
ncbi:MAG: hypothetical protein IT317_13670 [Anaerolineales bacterium]|nr:hypothetical protein [Anaerolineales bacterium]